MRTKMTVVGFGVVTMVTVLGAAAAMAAGSPPYTVTTVPGKVTVTAASGWHMQQPAPVLKCKVIDPTTHRTTETHSAVTTTDTTATASGHGECTIAGAVYNAAQKQVFNETVSL